MAFEKIHCRFNSSIIILDKKYTWQVYDNLKQLRTVILLLCQGGIPVAQRRYDWGYYIYALILSHEYKPS